MMNKISFEEELKTQGKLVYPNTGISMMPLLRQQRDLMVIGRRPQGRLKKYDAVLFKRKEQYVLHRILKVRDKDYVICGDNQWRPEKGITDEQIIGILLAVVRDGKEFSTEAFLYKLYVHLWCDLFPLRAAVLYVRDKVRGMIGKVR